MSRVNHNSLRFKEQAEPNKTYKDLKQKQKAKISDWMFSAVCDFYTEHGRVPLDDELEPLASRVYAKIQGAAISVPYHSFLAEFEKKLSRYAERISENGVSSTKPVKIKKTEKEKQAIRRANRRNRRRRKDGAAATEPLLERDDNFFFIAGYTSGGAPYGVTWEEMGLEPWAALDEEDETQG